MSESETRTIMIVDDEAALRFFVSSALAQQGWRVTEADSGEAALHLLALGQQDVLLLDLHMNGMDGLEVLEKVNAAWPETMVIIMTAYASVDSAISAIRHKAFDYLQKPCDTQVVLEAVERAWAEKQARLQLEKERGETAVFLPLPSRHTIHTADLVIDLNARNVTQQGQPVPLTPTEYEIIACLAENIGEPVSVGHLITAALDFDPNDFQAEETLRVHISRLRAKIGAKHIHTVRGGKYTLPYIRP
jgi:DNA-binding response OmpR family regulator